MNEKYVNSYIEVMTGIMQDAVLRNISLQANERIVTEVIQEQQQKIEELNELVEQLKNQYDSISHIQDEYENVKHKVHNADTFRNELIKEREEHKKSLNIIEELNDKIDYLQLTPAKRKKIDDAKLVSITETKPTMEEVEIVEDGGKF
jgi:hypothetical protein